MSWVRFLGYAAFSALGQICQVVILDKILSWCEPYRDFRNWNLSAVVTMGSEEQVEKGSGGIT
jgi:hypothetical protein